MKCAKSHRDLLLTYQFTSTSRDVTFRAVRSDLHQFIEGRLIFQKLLTHLWGAAMDDQNEFFSVYGETGNYATRRQEGLKLFRASIKATKASWALVGVVLSAGLTMAAVAAVQRAHAGAQFIIQRLNH